MQSPSEFTGSDGSPLIINDHAQRPHQQLHAPPFALSLPGFPGHVFAFNMPHPPAPAPAALSPALAPAAKSHSDILQDGVSRVCPECKRPFAYPSRMVRHFLQSHRDIAKNWLPHACLACAVNCHSEEGLDAHEKSTGHGAVASKKRTAAQAVRWYVVAYDTLLCSLKRMRVAIWMNRLPKTRALTLRVFASFASLSSPSHSTSNVTTTGSIPKVGCECLFVSAMLTRVSGPLPYVCKYPGCAQQFARSDEAGLKGHVDRDHNNGRLKKLNPVLVFRDNEVFLFAVRHTDRGRGTLYLLLVRVIIRAGGVGHVLVSFPGAPGVRCLCSCLFIALQVATRLCPDGNPRVWCDFQQCIPVEEIFRGTAAKSQSSGVAVDVAAEQLSLGEPCLLLVIMLALSVANCDHARACLLALDFQAEPAGVVSCDRFRSAITEATGDLIEPRYAPALLEVVNDCVQHKAPIVVPFSGQQGAVD